MASIVDFMAMFSILIFCSISQKNVKRKICEMEQSKDCLNNFEKRGCTQIMCATKMHDTLLCCYIFYFSQIEILKNILIKN